MNDGLRAANRTALVKMRLGGRRNGIVLPDSSAVDMGWGEVIDACGVHYGAEEKAVCAGDWVYCLLVMAQALPEFDFRRKALVRDDSKEVFWVHADHIKAVLPSTTVTSLPASDTSDAGCATS